MVPDKTQYPSAFYNDSLALLTDLYQLTMAYGYWKNDLADQEAVFHLFYRKPPFKGGYGIAAGLESVIDYVEQFHFSDSDIDYLKSLKGNNDKPIFEDAFLDYLADLKLEVDIDAIPEGTVTFPQEPLVRVKGSILQCQLLETPLLNLINFPSLIATKASRVCRSAEGDPVLEFGLRRAQGIDGGLTVARAAYIGGCTGTSNVLAGKVFGIPVKGTHAHSWVMCFDDELESFKAYARAMPNNCVFLVDTYDSLEGVRNACRVGKWLRDEGYEMVGIRLDSGDLAYLSKKARDILDEEGFPDAAIVASNDLDEHTIHSLKDQDAKIALWGVGTRLATAHDDPAMGGVYKLSAVREPGSEWEYRLKLSEQRIKTTNPGILQVRRFCEERDDGNTEFIADMIYHLDHVPDKESTMIDPLDATRKKHFEADKKCEDLLKPIFEKGKLVYEKPSLDDIRDRASAQLASFHEGVKRFSNPHEYPVGLEKQLNDMKTRLMEEAREEIES